MTKKHKLVVIGAYGCAYNAQVIRWCEKCGAVVVDGEFDNRTYPGHYMKMRIPAQTKETHCRAK